MTIRIKIICAVVMLAVGASFCWAANTNYYVVPDNAGATPPYTDWPTAATNIQDVVSRTLAGDTIYLTNGHYYLTGEVVIATAVTVKSYNCGATDPTNTIIDGNNFPGKPVTNRCLNISAAATIDGITLTNGVVTDNGGGCIMSGTYGVLTNCIVTGNLATNSGQVGGGGVYVSANNCTITDCQIVRNRSLRWGGGARGAASYLVLKNSFVGWNNVVAEDGAAVGLGGRDSVLNCTIVSNGNLGCNSIVYFIGTYAIVSNCVIMGNTNGAPVLTRENVVYYSNKVVNCRIIDNHSTGTLVPAGGFLSCSMLYRNCLIASNRATGAASCGGLRVSANNTGTVESCTIAGNQGVTAGAVYNDSSSSIGFFYNTIVCSNVGGTYSDMYVPGDATSRFFYSSCPTIDLPPAQGNLKSGPEFASFSAGDYHLTADSPCVNTGTNMLYWMTNAIDLEGRRRIDYLNGIVDMGAYEFMRNITLISGF